MLHDSYLHEEEKRYATQNLKITRDIALILLMFAGGMRQSEVVNIRFSDITSKQVNNEESIYINVAKTKTDNTNKDKSKKRKTGRDIIIAKNENDQYTCPIFWINNFDIIRDINAEYFFYNLVDGQKLGDRTPNKILKTWITNIGEDPTLFSSHSGKRGAITNGIKNGVNIEEMKKYAGYSSKSTSIYGYIDTNEEELRTVSKKIYDTEDKNKK
jgi:site-specific recombinase XerD